LKNEKRFSEAEGIDNLMLSNEKDEETERERETKREREREITTKKTVLFRRKMRKESER
jgi:hypothetical protein